jgi:hypothetical protein
VPSLTRTNFADVAEGMFEQAASMLMRDGTLYEAVYGFDRRTNPTSFVGLPDPSAWTSPATATALPAPLSTNAERIAATFRERQVVAAIHVAEAWLTREVTATLTPGALRELFARLDQARDEPGRIELVLVSGYWPREFIVRTRYGAIQRRPDGTLRGVKEIVLNDLEAPLTLASSWVHAALPQPPR